MDRMKIAILLTICLAVGSILLLPKYFQTEGVASLGPEEKCKTELALQQEYLRNEKYSEKYQFADYPADPPKDSQLLPFDPESSRYAQEFKTKLRESLAATDINFAKHYSVVSVGMTGWGNNYWIVDRRTGRAYEFPFYAQSLGFTADSRLIIMNSKEYIENLLAESEQDCYYLNQQKISDLRPFYFEWKDDKLSLLAPQDGEPPVNRFWIDYLSGISSSTPPYVAYFIRETRAKIVGDLKRVPNEGYDGFMLSQSFPGIVPEDFLGISTRYGDYRVENGRLYFFGNAPSDAAAIDAQGMEILLRNIAKRLAISIKNQEDVKKLIEKISS